MPIPTVRLTCRLWGRDDKDFITPEQLELCSRDGWRDIDEFQSFEEACQTYESPADQPPDFDILAWYTHTGICPECRDVA
jgi:hypothetical protein